MNLQEKFKDVFNKTVQEFYDSDYRNALDKASREVTRIHLEEMFKIVEAAYGSSVGTHERTWFVKMNEIEEQLKKLGE